jgi:hypothetical protein
MVFVVMGVFELGFVGVVRKLVIFSRSLNSIRKLHIEFGAVNGCPLDTVQGKHVAAKTEFFEIGLELVKGSPSIQQGANNHVAAGASKRIEVKVAGLHNRHAYVSHLR